MIFLGVVCIVIIWCLYYTDPERRNGTYTSLVAFYLGVLSGSRTERKWMVPARTDTEGDQGRPDHDAAVNDGQ